MTLNAVSRRASDVASHVKRQFGDTAGVQVTDTDIISWINDAQLEIAVNLKPIHGRADSATVANTYTYEYPAQSIVQIESIHYNGVKIENLTLALFEQMILSSDPKRTQTGVPSHWMEWAGVITLWPTPNAAGTLTIFYTGMPTRVVTISDLLGLPDKHYESIIFYVMSKAYEMDEEFEQSTNQRQQFLGRILDQSDEERVSAHLTYPTITFIED